MRIILAGDHAGFKYKQDVLNYLLSKGYHVDDVGAYSEEACDYPDMIHPAAKKVDKGLYDYGIFFCGTANGVAMTANKYQKVRAAICWNTELAALARQHNDANVLCIPCRFVSFDTALDMIETFTETDFEGGRHERRVSKIPC